MLSGLMNMEGIGTEEHVAVGSCNNNSHVIKGKRTKRRLKPLSPCVFTATSTAVTSSCSSASCGGDGGSFSSTTFEGTDQEEKDMANCLILLAQGKREREEEEEEGDRDRDPNHHHHQLQPQQQQYKLQKAENHVMVTKSGLDNYECKTCNRTFPSFQALGGHRASHKKPKMQVEKKSSPPPPPLPITATTGTATATREFEESNYDFKQSHMMMKNIITNAPPVLLELRCGVVVNNSKPNKPNKPNKIHECSICGSEFTSGQALGGHMRRHRASTSSNNNNNNNVDAVTTLSVFNDVNVKSRNVLELDLNLPAPEDDAFQFPATRKSVVLSSAPALVGCHY